MIIVYQSLNSGAQQVCGFKRKRSATNGYFTREASKYYADNDNIHMITNTPTKSRYAPTYGGLYSGIKLPKTGTFGESVSCSSYSTPSENGIVENKDLVSCVIRQMLNEINYMYVGQPELIVLGEIYLEEDFKCYGYKVEKLYDNKRACQCFTVLKKINAKGSISSMASNSDPSFPIIECNGVNHHPKWTKASSP